MLAISLLALLLFQPPAATLEEGLRLFHGGKYAEAREALQRLPESETRNVFLGLAEAATGHCASALPGLQASTWTTPELRRMAGLGAVQCLLAQDRISDALAIVQKLQAEFPGDADVLYQTARLHMRAFNDAVSSMYQRAPASYRVNQLSGEILEVQGRLADAAAEYRKALARNPKAVNLHYRLGRVLAMESKHDEALAEFEAELRLNPSDALAEYQVGQILALGPRREAAPERFARALQLKPDFVEAMIALAKLRPGPEALTLLEKAVGLAPRNEAARYALMIALRNAGRLEDAQRQKAELDRLQRPPEGEFSQFLKKLGEKPPPAPAK